MKLKALLLALCLGVLGLNQALAQDFHLGLEAGTNFSNFIGSGVSASSVTGSRLGLVGGVFLTLNFGNSFAIQPEVLYAQKGAKDTANNTYQLDYIEIPVLLKLSLGTPVINPGILAGPVFSWNTVAQVVNSGGSSSSISSVNPSDVGIMAGAQVDIDKFFVSGRYEVGLTDIVQGSGSGGGGGGGNSLQNGTITLLVGFSFI